MTYSTLLVHLDGAQSNTQVLAVAAALAERYQAKVIGIAACQPMQIGDAGYDFSGSLALLERDIVDDELKRAETEFRTCAELRLFGLEWRSVPTLEPVAHVIAREARCADLVITSLCSALSHNGLTHADTGDLIVHAGRPVLVVPDTPAPAGLKTVVVAWAETRECRRAVADALPILKLAEQIFIVSVSPELEEARSQTKDVIAWLFRHGISAHQVVGDPYGDVSGTLALITKNRGADLIVAGAFGHNRLREWAFGGVTQDLLLRSKICGLLSH